VTRLARNRNTHLTSAEIAAAALRCFDEGSSPPSIRQLATLLGTSSSAIYYHVSSRAEIVRAVVDLVWEEVTVEFLSLLTDRPGADPRDTMVKAGLATRRVFARHYRVAPFITATPDMTRFAPATIALMGDLLGALGLSPEEAASAFHAYASFTIGSVVFSALRRITNEEFADVRDAQAPDEGQPPDEMRRQLAAVVSVSTDDPGRDEALFLDGLTRLVSTFVPGMAAATTDGTRSELAP
jgi:AcrR family transcriptional regulator